MTKEEETKSKKKRKGKVKCLDWKKRNQSKLENRKNEIPQ